MAFTTFFRSEDEIANQIALLRDERDSLPEFSAFGDNNWASVDAAIDVLQGGDPEYYVEDENDIYNRALDAKDWLGGVSDNDLAEL
jgi:hypothetical protein